MRKYVGAMLVFSLLLFGTPLTIGAATNGEGVENTSSRTIKVTNKYSLGTIPPTYFMYNKGGWVGRLTLERYGPKDGYIEAIYKGVVSCTGTCPIGP
ncbi:hypothetical protein ACFFIS_12500 [Virgibacillus soli]|uniref:Uncharacterized protein n=1 Tax=Paracerasibacillus soli TaxID=480284 RepID=A0ABU5CPT8_9BACI|nr:hypothetical protein [Virgibacillus soli]MDY0407891.1 hypothetical protein [Virgibacillus soli]